MEPAAHTGAWTIRPVRCKQRLRREELPTRKTNFCLSIIAKWESVRHEDLSLEKNKPHAFVVVVFILCGNFESLLAARLKVKISYTSR